MKKRLSAIVTLLSLILLCVTMVMWVRSYWRSDRRGGARLPFRIVSIWGYVYLERVTTSPPPPPPLPPSVPALPDSTATEITPSLKSLVTPAPRGPPRIEQSWGFDSLQLKRSHFYSATSKVNVWYTGLAIADWLLAMFFAAGPMLWLWRRWRRSTRPGGFAVIREEKVSTA